MRHRRVRRCRKSDRAYHRSSWAPADWFCCCDSLRPTLATRFFPHPKPFLTLRKFRPLSPSGFSRRRTVQPTCQKLFPRFRTFRLTSRTFRPLSRTCVSTPQTFRPRRQKLRSTSPKPISTRRKPFFTSRKARSTPQTPSQPSGQWWFTLKSGQNRCLGPQTTHLNVNVRRRWKPNRLFENIFSHGFSRMKHGSPLLPHWGRRPG